VCFDVTSRSSFDHVSTKWLPEIAREGPKKTPILLVGTKIDRMEEFKNYFEKRKVEREALEKERKKRVLLLAKDPRALFLFDYSSLPFEIAFQILEFLDSKSLLRCERVCREWRRFKEDSRLWPEERLPQRKRPYDPREDWCIRTESEGGLVFDAEIREFLAQQTSVFKYCATSAKTQQGLKECMDTALHRIIHGPCPDPPSKSQCSTIYPGTWTTKKSSPPRIPRWYKRRSSLQQ